MQVLTGNTSDLLLYGSLRALTDIRPTFIRNNGMHAVAQLDYHNNVIEPQTFTLGKAARLAVNYEKGVSDVDDFYVLLFVCTLGIPRLPSHPKSPQLVCTWVLPALSVILLYIYIFIYLL